LLFNEELADAQSRCSTITTKERYLTIKFTMAENFTRTLPIEAGSMVQQLETWHGPISTATRNAAKVADTLVLLV
jgi:hypothetical protein